mmetsp:Transcript_9553/g.24442  ORF Transcript_9553/g.24442 Transcript_9553/m.24442 type:complete len:411 (+) Transcript_9553:1007-2239(+)
MEGSKEGLEQKRESPLCIFYILETFYTKTKQSNKRQQFLFLNFGGVVSFKWLCLGGLPPPEILSVVLDVVAEGFVEFGLHFFQWDAAGLGHQEEERRDGKGHDDAVDDVKALGAHGGVDNQRGSVHDDEAEEPVHEGRAARALSPQSKWEDLGRDDPPVGAPSRRERDGKNANEHRDGVGRHDVALHVDAPAKARGDDEHGKHDRRGPHQHLLPPELIGEIDGTKGGEEVDEGLRDREGVSVQAQVVEDGGAVAHEDVHSRELLQELDSEAHHGGEDDLLGEQVEDACGAGLLSLDLCLDFLHLGLGDFRAGFASELGQRAARLVRLSRLGEPSGRLRHKGQADGHESPKNDLESRLDAPGVCSVDGSLDEHVPEGGEEGAGHDAALEESAQAAAKMVRRELGDEDWDGA